jgi:hypothetical protein
VLKISRDEGFTITELLVATSILLLVIGAVLTTFKNAVQINDTAAQLGDSTQNLRAGTNLLIRDLMMAGRVFGAEGVALPTCAGAQRFVRPGPTAGFFNTVQVDTDETGAAVQSTLNLPSITTGYQLGPSIKGSPTDVVTIMTVDEFTPSINAQPTVSRNTKIEGTIAADGRSITLDPNSPWLVKDSVADTQPLQIGDLVLVKGQTNALLTVTAVGTSSISFQDNANDPFHFNQGCNPPNWPMGTVGGMSTTGACPAAVAPSTQTCFATPVTLFRAMMITYYVDNTTTPGTPRLTRQVNMFPSTALAGVVEDLDLTYDLVDGAVNPSAVPSLPWTDNSRTPAITYNSNQIRKVNVHVGVRSEQISKPTQDFVRNHISTAVDVRSLASVDKYKTTGDIQ